MKSKEELEKERKFRMYEIQGKTAIEFISIIRTLVEDLAIANVNCDEAEAEIMKLTEALKLCRANANQERETV